MFENKSGKDLSGESMPKEIHTTTQLTIEDVPNNTDDLTTGEDQIPTEGITEEEVEEANVINNPDVNSMESRG